MVPISEIRRFNSSFATAQDDMTDSVCVFLSATNGIGEGTLDVLCTMLASPTIYVVGRSSPRWETQHDHLRELNSKAKFVFIEAEVSTIRGVDQACNKILAAEEKVDYLCMSTGYFPLVGAIETPEGLEQCFTLSYWARIRLLDKLLPLLRRSARPRVLSILSGGREGILRDDDMGLEKNWTIPALINQTTTMMTLVFHHFAEHNPHFTLVHAWPGLVRTDTGRKPKPDASASFLWRWTFAGLRQLMLVMATFKGISIEESGQRHAYLLTSDRYTPGVWRVNEFSDTSPRSEKLEKYVEQGTPGRVWDFTVATWKKALENNSQTVSG